MGLSRKTHSSVIAGSKGINSDRNCEVFSRYQDLSDPPGAVGCEGVFPTGTEVVSFLICISFKEENRISLFSFAFPF